MAVNQPYLSRVVDNELDINLRTLGAVLIECPKWCGKTWLANWLERNMGARVIPFIIDPLEIVSYAYHYPGQIYVMDLTRTQSVDEPEVFGALEAIANGRLMTRTAEGVLKTAVRRPSKIVIMSNNNTIPRSISKERLSAYILPAERGIEREDTMRPWTAATMAVAMAIVASCTVGVDNMHGLYSGLRCVYVHIPREGVGKHGR